MIIHMISDSHCGMRSFTADADKRMGLQTTGMEFASEMVIKAVQTNLKILEIPIIYHPRGGESKLNAVRDAWRHIRFMLKYKLINQTKHGKPSATPTDPKKPMDHLLEYRRFTKAKKFIPKNGLAFKEPSKKPLIRRFAVCFLIQNS